MVCFLCLLAALARRGGSRRRAAPPREDLARPFALAAGLDEATGAYRDVVDGKALPPGGLGSRLLVRREAIPAPPEAPRPPPPGGKASDDAGSGGDPDTPQSPPDAPRPKRFFASLKLDPERAGLDVARIMDGLLVELTRAPGAGIELTLEIAGTAGEAGYPPDVVDTVTANARDLRLDEDELGFEKD